MTSDLDRLATRFCRELAEETGQQSMQWRTVLFIGARCRIRSPSMLEEIVDHAAKAGWLAGEGGRRVALTEMGLRLVHDMDQQATKRYRSKSRLSS
jgi:hypothetical protein